MNEEKAPISAEIPKKSKWKGIAREIVIFAIIAFGVVLPFRMYVAEPYLVDGRSMDPTFETGQYLIVNKLSFELENKLERSDVIVFRYPNNTSKNFIKRVIGLPGETVILKKGKTTIVNTENPEGMEIDESFVVYASPNDNMSITLSEDEYFVMGDNRAESFDSRAWGPLNTKYVLGKPMLRLFPFTKIDFMPGKVE